MDLWLDNEYVELGEDTIKKIRAAVNKGEVISKIGTRAIRLLETQDDYSFVNDMVKHSENGASLAEAIYRRGEKLIKALKPIPFAEGHHDASVGSHGRLKNYSFRNTLKINAINASRGSFVGTGPKNLSFLSRYIHSSEQAIAHINPWVGGHLLRDGAFPGLEGIKTTDTGIWTPKSKSFLPELPQDWETKFNTTNRKHAQLLLRAQQEAILAGKNRDAAFHRSLDPFTAARRFTDQTLDPQRMLSRAAYMNPTELAARNAIKDILGIDVFAIKDPKKIQEIYKITSAAGLNMNEFYEMSQEGTLNKINFKKANPGGIKQLIQQARKGVKIKPPSLVSLSKAFTKANIMNVLTAGASFADVGIPDKDVADELRKEDKSKGWEMYRNQLQTSGITIGLLRAATMIPKIKAGVALTAPIAANPLTWIVGGGLALNKLDENVFEGKGKDLLDKVKPRLPLHTKEVEEDYRERAKDYADKGGWDVSGYTF